MISKIFFINFFLSFTIKGGLEDLILIPSIPFLDETTIAPRDKASIILILVPEPNFNGTHKHFE